MSTEFYPLTISNVERLTKDSVAIDFTVPENLKTQFEYKQGQHLTLKADIKGQDVRRSYSICKGVNSQTLRVGVKAIEDGIFSNFANQELKKGMNLEVMPPQGHFYSELSPESNKHYLLVAVGSGITPMLSQIESILENEPSSQISLLYGNKRTPLMMFREHLCFLKNQYLDRFKIFNFFTKEENDAAILNGRISAQKIIDLDQARMISIRDLDDIFVCGPEAMTLEIANAFKSWSFDDSQIHYELFFSGDNKASAEILEQKVEGTDVTIVSFGKIIKEAYKAADELAKENISVEIIDLRTVRPMDHAAIITSVKKTNRLVILEEAWPFASVSSEITYRIQDEAFDYLDAPIKRITTADTPAPYSPVLFEKWIPNYKDVIKAVKEVLYI